MEHSLILADFVSWTNGIYLWCLAHKYIFISAGLFAFHALVMYIDAEID